MPPLETENEGWPITALAAWPDRKSLENRSAGSSSDENSAANLCIATCPPSGEAYILLLLAIVGCFHSRRHTTTRGPIADHRSFHRVRSFDDVRQHAINGILLENP